MIRMIQSKSAAGAKSYFSSALSQADYYINDQELKGKFQGKLVNRLGLGIDASKDDFFALCENRHPKNGDTLTQRVKENRTVGYDINFHCPKSVSIVHALSGDRHIMDLFEQSVSETMQEIERDAMTRVRKGGKYQDRKTSELVWAEFTHQTARPVEHYAPDPHLHAHCFVFNATWDEDEKSYKAAQFRDIKRDMPYYQARFHKTLADKLSLAGYEIERTKNSFEIKGVPKRVIDYFSKRTDEIGRIAEEKGIHSAKVLDALGARTRSRKQQGMSMSELRQEWKRQIRQLETVVNLDNNPEYNAPIRKPKERNYSSPEPDKAVSYALNHAFERSSVMPERRLLAEAYRYTTGQENILISQIDRSVWQNPNIIRVKEKGRIMCTTKEVLSEEKEMVNLARKGVGKVIPLYKQAPALNVTGQQKNAVEHILTTSNRVSIVRGAAGSGKTTLMKEAAEKIRATGKEITVIAPTAQASRGVLKDEGFDNAETVAKFLVDTKMQESIKDQVLWVDEAGLLGTGDMKRLLQITDKQNARLILGGDTRQHASVVRGDALRILNTVGGIKTAEVNKIYRQRKEAYREAVQDLSNGDVKTAFDKLDNLGAVKEIDSLKPNMQLVDDYVATIKKGKSALIISPTHKQGEEVTSLVREQLKQQGIIGKREISAKKLSNLNMTEAEKSDYRSYQQGHVLQFNQNIKGVKRGSTWMVENADEKNLYIRNSEDKEMSIAISSSKNFDVFEEKEIRLAKGDKIHVTRNGFDTGNKRLNNGDSLEIKSVSKKNGITLINPKSKHTYHLDKDFGHISHAHCVTSYASQGKTVDEIFIHQPAATFAATDAKQFYVSVSRGRDDVHIYTDDKEQLLEYTSEFGNRQSAMELVEHRQHDYVRQNLITKEQQKEQNKQEVTKQYNRNNYTRDYEL
ncbi:MobF family relaxase [Myroides sp. DW712]|uniref:MobF family relaxase n=1 Tax=Myroides sp. DW712 TaxID=3389800 RepID=UPI00397DE378